MQEIEIPIPIVLGLNSTWHRGGAMCPRSDIYAVLLVPGVHCALIRPKIPI